MGLEKERQTIGAGRYVLLFLHSVFLITKVNKWPLTMDTKNKLLSETNILYGRK